MDENFTTVNIKNAYMFKYHIKVASYTGFHLKRTHIANSSQVKLKVKLVVTSLETLLARDISPNYTL